MSFTDFLWIIGIIGIILLGLRFNHVCARGRQAGDEAAKKYFEELKNKENVK